MRGGDPRGHRRVAGRTLANSLSEVAVLRGRRRGRRAGASVAPRRARALSGARRSSRRGGGAPLGRAILLRRGPLGERAVLLPGRHPVYLARPGRGTSTSAVIRDAAAIVDAPWPVAMATFART